MQQSIGLATVYAEKEINERNSYDSLTVKNVVRSEI